MKKIKDVFQFEYFLIVKSKSFLFTTAFLVILCVGLNMAPGLISIFKTHGAIIKIGNTMSAAYIDASAEFSNENSSGYSGDFTNELLAQYFPEITWERYDDSRYDELQNKVEGKKLLFGVRFSGGLAYDLITADPPGADVYRINDMIKSIYLKRTLTAAGFTTQQADELSAAASPNLIFLGDT